MRDMAARLSFEVCGGRTILWRQHVPYPLHVTRAFHLDAGHPELATLYLQSASGGLYRGDRVALEINAGPDARVHVTTQSATIVHDTRAAQARQDCRIVVATGACVALTPDPLVMFPGAAVETTTEVVLAPDAGAVLSEAVAWHDPRGLGRKFARYAASITVRAASGGVLATDRSVIEGDALGGPASPLGPWQATGCVLILGRPVTANATEIVRSLAKSECLAGASPLPNGAGLAIRVLAASGGDLSRGLQAACDWAIGQSFGVLPARRPK
jgi:urease accessory protein